MEALIGFIIALCVGLTGVGGGSFTAPALVLIAGLAGADAVGTALVYSLVIRLAAAPFYVLGKNVNFRYLWLMLLGALPGLMAGTYFLATLNAKRWNHIILVMIGATLICSSVLTLIYRKAGRLRHEKKPSWLPWFTFPIGMETGFSSAGAGALGTILLFNWSDMPASQVVGTDLLFGIGLAAGGTLFHLSFGSISIPALKALLLGGIPGVLLGCVLAPRVPPVRLKPFIIGLTFLLGLQLIWNGMRVWH